MRGRVTWPNPPARASQQSAPAHVEARNKTSAAASDKNQINIRDINVAGAYNVRGNILSPTKRAQSHRLLVINLITLSSSLLQLWLKIPPLNPLVESKTPIMSLLLKKV